MSTATVENTPAETPEVTEPVAPILAKVEDANPLTQAALPLVKAAYDAYNAVVTQNLSSSKTETEIAESLVETSTDTKVVKIREQIASLTEDMLKAVAAQAKELKAKAGDPDTEGEAKAKSNVKAAQAVLAMTPDGDKVDHFLPALVKGGSTRKIGQAANTGPKRDLSEVRAWAKANVPDFTADRGRIPADVLDAYTKATGKSVE